MLRRAQRPHGKRLQRRYCTSSKPVVVTTPIFYVNAGPHIGHLYSTLLADAIARWHRSIGRSTRLITGTDEHGLKVEEAAAQNKMTPQAWCDHVSAQFRTLFQRANISNDDFIRTTEARHRTAVEALWRVLRDNDHIYLGKFEGWYSVPDETFLTPQQVRKALREAEADFFAQVTDGVDKSGKPCKVSVESGHPVQWVVEPNYMFKLSALAERVTQWIQTQSPIIPEARSNQILTDLNGPVRDLSVSRLRDKLKWGIPVPDDPSHVIYVWLDALTNYLTVCGYPTVPMDGKSPESLWPVDYHVLGKDIAKFHSLFWPAFLMAAKLPLPKKLVIHAHWTMNKEKMSKSKGNVVDPHKLLDQYGVDAVRFFMLKEGGMADDADFSDLAMFNRITSDLSDNFGNLIARITTANLNPQLRRPHPHVMHQEEKDMAKILNELPDKVDVLFRSADFRNGLELIFEALRETNRYIQARKPWQLVPKPNKADPSLAPSGGDYELLLTSLYFGLESIRISGLLLQPIMPKSMEALLEYLQIPADRRNPMADRFGFEYPAAISVAKPLILFTKPTVNKDPVKKATR